MSNPEAPEKWGRWWPLAGGGCGWQWQSDPSSRATQPPGLTLNPARGSFKREKALLPITVQHQHPKATTPALFDALHGRKTWSRRAKASILSLCLLIVRKDDKNLVCFRDSIADNALDTSHPTFCFLTFPCPQIKPAPVKPNSPEEQGLNCKQPHSFALMMRL